MAKKKKSKAAQSTTSSVPIAVPDSVDDGLLDDLLAQLDEKDAAQQQEAATILHEADLNAQAETLESDPSATKKDSRARFEARKVRRCVYQL